MEIDPAACRQAVVARDARFDGHFVVVVATTGIYCRPVCPARTPRADRCRYYALAAQAEAEGYRPCLRCRPEVAPGRSTAPVDARARLVADAVAAIDRGFLIDHDLEDLAAYLGVTARHLRRAVVAALGVTPGQLDRSRRFAMAKQLLHDSRASITEVALAAGFGSVRRWNAAFREHFATTPSSFRRATAAPTAAPTAALTVRLDARPPYAGRALLAFLAGRAVAGVEEIGADTYRRTVDDGWLEVRVLDDAARPGVRLTVAASLGPRLLPIAARVRQLFDLDAEPAAIAAQLAADPRLAPLVAAAPGRRVPGAFDPFEVAVRTVLGQQVSVAAASTLCGRLVARFGAPATTPFAALTHRTPSAATLAAASEDDLAAIGLPRARAATLRALARAVVDGAVALDAGGDPAAAMAALTAIRGIGPWTASYLAMRALRWPDAFPAGDLVLQRQLGVGTAAAAEAASTAWRPWRAYAALHLWAAAGGRGG